MLPNASNCRFPLIVASLFILVYISGGCTKTKNPVDMKEADRDDAVLVSITRDGKFYLGPGEAKVSDSLPSHFAARTEIRVRNASQADLKDVVIEGKKFGDIKQDAVTEYRKSEFAHRYAPVSLLANSKPLETMPTVYGAETELGSGRFTYVLTIQGGRLNVHAEKDKD
jgi:hypothetical protein